MGDEFCVGAKKSAKIFLAKTVGEYIIFNWCIYKQK